MPSTSASLFADALPRVSATMAGLCSPLDGVSVLRVSPACLELLQNYSQEHAPHLRPDLLVVCGMGFIWLLLVGVWIQSPASPDLPPTFSVQVTQCQPCLPFQLPTDLASLATSSQHLPHPTGARPGCPMQERMSSQASGLIR